MDDWSLGISRKPFL
ncbi:hypothetical protein RDI58_035312 [Solanum bulbocastanum]|uniref:Uncharacterized protein n=1 Tax=Solanum bulbocastanum TaxID=147425 RepID=A0AAN8SK06_SOLBU